MNTKLKRNSMLDFLKGIACIGVVLIHVTLPGFLGEIVVRTSYFAVPLFCMISGYYTYNCEPKKIIKRFKKILLLFILGYFMYAITYIMSQATLKDWMDSILSVKSLVKLLVFCTVDFATPLWYLIAMAETYIFWYFIEKNKWQDILIKLLPLLFVVRVVLITYCETRDLSWFCHINFVTGVLPWFVFGYYIKKVEPRVINKTDNRIIALVAVVGYLITVSSLVLNIPIPYSIGVIPYACSVFLIAIKKNNQVICKYIEFIGKNISQYIYIVHVPIYKCICYLNHNRFNGLVFDWCLPFITIIFSILFSLILFYIKKRIVLIRSKTQIK